MGDANDTGALELFVNELLDSLLGDHVDVRCGLVKDNDAVRTQDCPDDTDELALTYTQVLAFLFDFKVETFVI